MGIIPERKEYKNFTYEKYTLFIDNIQSLGYTKVTHTPHNSKSHLDRYGYLDDGKKVAVVYDLKAKMLTITAPDKSIKALGGIIKVLDGKSPKAKKIEQKAEKEVLAENKKPGNKKADKNKTDQGFFQKKAEKQKSKAKTLEEPKKTNKKAEKLKKKAEDKSATDEKSNKKAKKKKEKDRTADQASIPKEESKAKNKMASIKGVQGPFALIDDYYPLSFTKAMHKIRNTSDIKINTLPTKNVHREDETASYIIVKGGKSSEVRYMPNKGSLEIYGDVISELKEKYLEFGGREIASSDLKKESKYEKMLQKLMPTAVQYLTVEEMNDIGSGYEELKKATDHYEYSMFLLSPFKGLENFIFDLQKRMGISVKLLGQAFDKDKYGNYVLKETYQKRCGVVLSEVMVALYTEYYSKRNFYTHSGDGKEHRISQKNQAVLLVEDLLYCIEYNCRKLLEISFSIR